MSITTESLSPTNKPIHTDIEDNINEITNIVDGHHRTLVIVLTVILPTIVFIAIMTAIVIIYRRRRRYSTIWLKKLENPSRLQAIVVNLSPIPIGPQYLEKKLNLSHPQYQQPSTKTIVYNRMSAPGTPIVYSSFQLPIKGETNAAFDECSFKNALNSASSIESSAATLETEFPVSLQAPVPSITSTFVEAIALHRVTLVTNTNMTSSETSASTSASDHSRDSGTPLTSYSNSSQTILLFSQRTEF